MLDNCSCQATHDHSIPSLYIPTPNPSKHRHLDQNRSIATTQGLLTSLTRNNAIIAFNVQSIIHNPLSLTKYHMSRCQEITLAIWTINIVYIHCKISLAGSK